MPATPSERILDRSLAWVVVATMRKVPSARTPAVGGGSGSVGCAGVAGRTGGRIGLCGLSLTPAGGSKQGDKQGQDDDVGLSEV